MSNCPWCGAPARFEIRLPDGTSIPAASLAEANGLLRTHQRQWPNEDLSIGIVATPHKGQEAPDLLTHQSAPREK